MIKKGLRLSLRQELREDNIPTLSSLSRISNRPPKEETSGESKSTDIFLPDTAEKENSSPWVRRIRNIFIIFAHEKVYLFFFYC